MLNRVLTRVDFPRPDSPGEHCEDDPYAPVRYVRTDNHHIEVEPLADALAVPLVRQVGETDVAGELAAHDVLHIGSGLGHSLGVPGGDRLGNAGAHGVAALHKGRLLTGVGRLKVAGHDWGAVRSWRSYQNYQCVVLAMPDHVS